MPAAPTTTTRTRTTTAILRELSRACSATRQRSLTTSLAQPQTRSTAGCRSKSCARRAMERKAALSSYPGRVRSQVGPSWTTKATQEFEPPHPSRVRYRRCARVARAPCVVRCRARPVIPMGLACCVVRFRICVARPPPPPGFCGVFERPARLYISFYTSFSSLYIFFLPPPPEANERPVAASTTKQFQSPHVSPFLNPPFSSSFFSFFRGTCDLRTCASPRPLGHFYAIITAHYHGLARDGAIAVPVGVILLSANRYSSNSLRGRSPISLPPPNPPTLKCASLSRLVCLFSYLFTAVPCPPPPPQANAVRMVTPTAAKSQSRRLCARYLNPSSLPFSSPRLPGDLRLAHLCKSSPTKPFPTLSSRHRIPARPGTGPSLFPWCGFALSAYR